MIFGPRPMSKREIRPPFPELKNNLWILSIWACAVGLIAAGAVAGLIGAAQLTWVETVSGSDRFLGVLAHTAGWSLVALVFGFLPMVLIGLPIQAQMARHKLIHWWWYPVCAFWCGGVVAAAIMPSAALTMFSVGAFVGALAGFFAWLIRRPDLDHLR
jgi:hypothetical protein